MVRGCEDGVRARTEGWIDGQTDGQTDGQMDRHAGSGYFRLHASSTLLIGW